ncbi:unannotated protein [freshwater metagenome]|uniref:thioredoxin-dependent peroxiredoxin n=1 Tax=freshwater metagenome TaxID=449393 RepID=A0A6J7ITT7_9ZZZZ|nr:redoxin domain-containing protein [Actinomycetota bacterium]
MAKGLQVGDVAPDFELPGTAGPFRLSERRGERVVLLFYPGDDTPGCTKQFCSYRDRSDDVGALGATLVGISRQDLDSHAGFTSKHGLTVPLLADVDGAVATAYGVAAPVVGTRRAVFIVDEDGIVRFRKVHVIGLRFEDSDDLKAALDALPPRAVV